MAALHGLEKGLQEPEAVTALTPCRPPTSKTSEHHRTANENPRESLCTVHARPEFGYSDDMPGAYHGTSARAFL